MLEYIYEEMRKETKEDFQEGFSLENGDEVFIAG